MRAAGEKAAEAELRVQEAELRCKEAKVCRHPRLACPFITSYRKANS